MGSGANAAEKSKVFRKVGARTARYSSALSVDDFVKKTQYVYYDKNALAKVAKDVEFFAKKEGLTAHAKSAVVRFED